MSSISNVNWNNLATAETKQKEQESSASAIFSETLQKMKQGGSETENDDGSKTVIERSTITGPDGTQLVVLTQVTISQSGQRSEPKVIAKYKLSTLDNPPEAPVQTKAASVSVSKAEDPAADTAPPNYSLKNTIGREYENNSVVSAGMAGILLSESI